MTTIAIPAPLHDVFGDRQSPASLALIVLAMPLAVIAVWPALSLLSVELWRAALAAVLVADIAAGAVANVTRGTNDHYAASARRRTVFLAVHVHLPVVALLLDLPLLPALVAWALTIIAATLVVLLGQSTLQRPVAVVGVIAVLSVTALFSETSTVLLLVTGLFAIKVVLSFAVDHNRVAGP